MPCEDGRKYLLGDYARGVLAEREAAPVREHLKDCPDCRQDLAQFERLLPLLAHFAEEHIPADYLIDYYHRDQERLAQGEDGFWNAEIVEKHLSVCDQCQGLFDKLTLAEKEFAEVSGLKKAETFIEKPFLKRWVFLRSRRVLYAAVAAAALLLFLIPNLPLRSQGPMIAVLPFEYKGPAEKEYFAESISDEISKSLEKISAIGVISSSSTRQYKNTDKTPSQIGKELGVNYLLTGTVRLDTTGKFAKLRVAARLMRTENQTEIWREPFEIIWGEICNLPGAITRKVVSVLNIELLEPEHQALESCPTGNIEAYEYYLRGNLFFKQPWRMHGASDRYRKAVELDSGFALAYIMFARASVELFWHEVPEEHLLPQARKALNKAFQLQPDLPEAHLALASFYYHELENDSALSEFALAEKALAKNRDFLEQRGFLLRRMAKWEEAAEMLKKAFKLDPQDGYLAVEIGQTFRVMLQYPEAHRYYDIALPLMPQQARPQTYGFKAGMLAAADGNSRRARKFLQEMVGDSAAKRTFYDDSTAWDGNYEKALGYFQINAARIVSESVACWWAQADLYGRLKRPEPRRACLDSARMLLETAIRRLPARPTRYASFYEGYLHSQLGLVYAHLGKKEEAVREGEKAVELTPPSKDAFNARDWVINLAEIYVTLGETEKAVDWLEYYTSFCPYLEKNRFIGEGWAPVRNHPRFQRLINERA